MILCQKYLPNGPTKRKALAQTPRVCTNTLVQAFLSRYRSFLKCSALVLARTHMLAYACNVTNTLRDGAVHGKYLQHCKCATLCITMGPRKQHQQVSTFPLTFPHPPTPRMRTKAKWLVWLFKSSGFFPREGGYPVLAMTDDIGALMRCNISPSIPVPKHTVHIAFTSLVPFAAPSHASRLQLHTANYILILAPRKVREM